MPDRSPSPLYDALAAATGAADGGFVLGRIAQSLDGRIAMPSGESRYISGHPDIVHTHRLRALFDAVLVGAGTVRADDPELTTRHVSGASPVRVVLDAERRLGADYRVFRDGRPTLLVCAPDSPGPPSCGDAEVVAVPRGAAGFDMAALLAALQARGLRRVMVEGGGVTLSRFLAAGALDRLHVTVAPLLLGSGVPAFTLPPLTSLADGLRFAWQVHRLGDDILIDIPLTRRRAAA
jgi:riboflavin-specific deaminase-like protein